MPLPDSAFVAFGESALLVQLEGPDEAQALAAALHDDAPAGVTATVPGLASLLVEFDPLETDAAAVRRHVAAVSVAEAPATAPRLRTIPVVYGGEHGPDLEDVARETGLSADAVVELHSGTELRVLFDGFAPGFAYLGEVPEPIRVARLATPRTRTPRGSVAIAGAMSGVYPADLPGGWRVIGRTPIVLFDPQRAAPAYLAPGDRVRFEPIPAGEWSDRQRVPVDW